MTSILALKPSEVPELLGAEGGAEVLELPSPALLARLCELKAALPAGADAVEYVVSQPKLLLTADLGNCTRSALLAMRRAAPGARPAQGRGFAAGRSRRLAVSAPRQCG